MFGIGPLELIVIGIVAVVFIGPERLPDAMRKFGKMFVTVRRHANDVKNSFQEVIHDAERELELDKIRELQAKLQATTPTQLLETTFNPPKQAAPEELGTPDSEAYDYHDSHYADGTYKAHSPDHMPLTHDPFADLPSTPPAAIPAAAATPATTTPATVPATAATPPATSAPAPLPPASPTAPAVAPLAANDAKHQQQAVPKPSSDA